jgi:hypothetical protein
MCALGGGSGQPATHDCSPQNDCPEWRRCALAPGRQPERRLADPIGPMRALLSTAYRACSFTVPQVCGSTMVPVADPVLTKRTPRSPAKMSGI